MHVRSLRLENFGGFVDTEFRLNRRATLFVGENGSGKSTIASGLRWVVAWMTGNDDLVEQACAPAHDLCRHGASGPSLVSFHYDEKRYRWSFTSSNASFPSPTEDPVAAVHMGPRRDPFRIPLMAQIEDCRLHHAMAIRSELVFQVDIEWFRREENLENETRLNGDPDHRRPELQAVREALTRFLNALGTGSFRNPRISRADASGEPWPGEPDGILVVDKDGQQLTIRQLSDGERLMLLTVMDIARRLVLLNDSDPLEGPGLVVIDEIELHLHPGWQRRVLPALMDTFPGIQFVATTHSPQVVGSVPGECIRILEDFQVYEAPPTLGRDSNSLLEDVFGVPERAPDTLQALDEVASLIDADDLDAAKSRLAALREQLTSSDPEVARLEGLLTFLAS